MTSNPAARVAIRTFAGALALMALAAGSAQANVSPLSSSIQYTDASSSTCDKPAWA